MGSGRRWAAGMITVRYFAGARAAAGTPQQPVAGPATLAELVAALVSQHGEPLGKVLAAASFLVNGVAWREADRQLPEAAVVDVLPPFAGG
jgi:molybdopterin converting factor small subunit